MIFSRLQKVALTGLTAAGGIALYSMTSSNDQKQPPRVVHNSWTTNTKPSVKWDSNWDHREPTSIVKPSKGTPEDDNRYNCEIEKATPKAVRHIFLIRHGQYNLDGETDKQRILTELGREQAASTGKRLRDLGIKWDCLVKSTMTRAQETADIINDQLDPDLVKSMSNCSLLEEGAPIAPEPPVGHWKPEPYFFQEGARIEAAFRKHIHRAHPSQQTDSFSLVVCHANVIRYFICRAMQFPPEAWLRISLNHASITWISIQPSGRVILRCIGDTGHMDPKKISSR